jgi:hypothetical protein
MAAKKTATTTVKTENKETAAKKTIAKKTVAAKPAVKKAVSKVLAAEVKPVEAKPAEEKKPAVKKAAAKVIAAEAVKKTAEKKEAAEKKAPAKKAAAKKPAVAKKSFQEYKDVINWKKWEAHNMNWLYIEVNAGDLMQELEAGVNNIKTVTEAILDSMLEGDTFIVESEKPSTKLTVRYYCDNLSEERRKYSEVNG